jgi:hypothetical protein
MGSAYPIFVTIAEHWQLFDVGYLGRTVSGGFLGAGVILNQDCEVNLRLERERDIHPVGCEAIGRELKPAGSDCLFHLHQERPASIRIPLANVMGQCDMVNHASPSFPNSFSTGRQHVSRPAVSLSNGTRRFTMHSYGRIAVLALKMKEILTFAYTGSLIDRLTS